MNFKGKTLVWSAFQFLRNGCHAIANGQPVPFHLPRPGRDGLELGGALEGSPKGQLLLRRCGHGEGEECKEGESDTHCVENRAGWAGKEQETL